MTRPVRVTGVSLICDGISAETVPGRRFAPRTRRLVGGPMCVLEFTRLTACGVTLTGTVPARPPSSAAVYLKMVHLGCVEPRSTRLPVGFLDSAPLRIENGEDRSRREWRESPECESVGRHPRWTLVRRGESLSSSAVLLSLCSLLVLVQEGGTRAVRAVAALGALRLVGGADKPG